MPFFRLNYHILSVISLERGGIHVKYDPECRLHPSAPIYESENAHFYTYKIYFLLIIDV